MDTSPPPPPLVVDVLVLLLLLLAADDEDDDDFFLPDLLRRILRCTFSTCRFTLYLLANILAHPG